jgi:hypothetical protein
MNLCRVYWGSHGCSLERGHDGPHLCSCAGDPDDPGVLNVGAPPYYGPDTHFYGEDVQRRRRVRAHGVVYEVEAPPRLTDKQRERLDLMVLNASGPRVRPSDVGAALTRLDYLEAEVPAALTEPYEEKETT